MISFKTRNDAASGVLMILGIVLVVGAAGWALVKLPDKRTVVAPPPGLAKQQSEIDDAARKQTSLQNEINQMDWGEGPDEVVPEALAVINRLAVLHHLKVTAFRPQKSVSVVGMTEIPFALTVEGTFLDTMGFVRDLETTDTKLAVNLVQVNSAESSTDHVSGTVNFVAYLKAAPAPANSAKGGKNA